LYEVALTAGSVHIVGAGLAGLAAAVVLAAEGCRVRLYEASAHAGGRCRSYFDDELGCRIDNGNHLLLAGNRPTILRTGCCIGSTSIFIRPNLIALAACRQLVN